MIAVRGVVLVSNDACRVRSGPPASDVPWPSDACALNLTWSQYSSRSRVALLDVFEDAVELVQCVITDDQLALAR